ncbi:MAG: hypothetical protein JWO56_3683 [Acidobacteria bacterium]|nr:hypothetical protein [Acidobacteriota bacterium]
MSARVLTVFLAGLSLFVAADPAFAWNSDAHTMMSELAFERIGDEKCFQVFVLAADDPDAIRKQRPWLFYTHSNDRQIRANDALNAAIRTMVYAGRVNSEAYVCEAARHFAHAFHYVQDAGDPTQEFPWAPFMPSILPFQWGTVRPHDYHEYSRDSAERLLAGFIAESRSGAHRSGFWQHLASEERLFANLDIPAIFARLEAGRVLGGKNLIIIQNQRLQGPRDAYGQPYPTYGQDIFENQLSYSLALIVAAERRFNILFQEGALREAERQAAGP